MFLPHSQVRYNMIYITIYFLPHYQVGHAGFTSPAGGSADEVHAVIQNVLKTYVAPWLPALKFKTIFHK